MLDELKTLMLIAETGSLQAAANRRGLTQSAVTRQMQRLEDRLGAELLDRRVKPLRLTRAGRSVLAGGAEVLAAIDKLKHSVAADAKPSGTLRIGLAHGVSEPSIAAPVERFKARLPTVFPSFQSNLSARLVECLRADELDCAVVLWDIGRDPPAGLPARVVGTERMAIVEAATPGPTGDSGPRERAWVVNPAGCLFRTKLQQWLEADGGAMRVAAEAHDRGLQAAFVASGLGLGLVSERLLAGHPLGAALRPAELDGPDLAAQVLVVRASGLGPLNAAVDALEEELARFYVD